MRRMRRGDTLVEVLIAVAIFSVAALAAVGIMNHGLNSVQSSLETTMARTEIDAQAESLRFIHDAYSSGKNVDAFRDAWHKILSLSQNPGTADFTNDITVCENVYRDDGDQNSLFAQKSFVVNSRKLNENQNTDIIIQSDTSKFEESPVSPRILYSDGNALFSDSFSLEVAKAQGLWVVAVRDRVLTDAEEEDPASYIEYLDFYIRTCWNTPGNGTATNLSTTIRLHNPDGINSPSLNRRYNFGVTYDPNGSNVTNLPENFSTTSYVDSEYHYTIPFVIPTRPGYHFLGWSTTPTGSPNYRYDLVNNSISPNSITLRNPITLYAIWAEQVEYCIQYFPNPPAGITVSNMPAKTCVMSSSDPDITVSDQRPFARGYDLQGWSLEQGNSTTYSTIHVSESDVCSNSARTKCVYAYWREINLDSNFRIVLDWGDEPHDLDSWLYGMNSDSTALWSSPVYYSHKTQGDKAALEYDHTQHGGACLNHSGNCPEVITLKTATSEDRNHIFFYSVWAYTSGQVIYPGTKVILTNTDTGREYVFDYPTQNGNQKCWNVFAIRNSDEVVGINETFNAAGQDTCATTTYDLSGRSSL